MVTKDRVLGLLEASRGAYFSGEDLAQSLSVSRAAIWKAVNALRDEGYSIHAVSNKGYCLSEKTDILSAQGIEKYLNDSCRDLVIEYVPVTESTSTLIRQKLSRDGIYVLVAGSQSAGKGRSGRFFFSPPDTGAYFSLLLRPKDCTSSQALKLTTMAAVSMCEAIEEVSDEKPKIKWVNDIFMGGKKVCGILTEGSFNMESGLLEYAVLGVGVNIYPPRDGFPQELCDIAGAVFESPGKDMKNRLTAGFLNHFMGYYKSGKDYIGEYRKRSLVIGKDVTVVSEAGSRKARVLGIDQECRLQLQYAGGETATLSYGEIRIQP